ncbi:hypothetical protein [Eoetvoesiella caeni]|uniref:hypothetical protein n=1 Tax=Eoetvoesiella caeni TaxID=645616 RepID=UPI001475031D|nr:hypothetical protein [Eoetvoesiella caeni]MCI2807705.1 hypothetical protein [Eoetvoesiella caeni]NYT52900.1 hypothetical protein [Eoetvoesiella caeni]
MSPEQARKFAAHKEAMQLYFADERVDDIVHRTGVPRRNLARMAKKCLLEAPDGRIFGFRALIPYIRTSCYQRHAQVQDKRQHQQGGQAGALGATLVRFPDLEDELVKCIKQDSKHKQIPENKLRAKDLHRLFIQCVKGKGVSESEWPFTTQYLGVRTIQKYMNRVLNDNFSRSVFSREGSAAKAHMNVGTGHASFLTFEEPYDAVEIDAYKLDAHFTVAFETPEGTETEVLLERLWLVAAVERASTAMLAYDMVYRSEVTADNILKVIRDALTKKWQPKALTLPLNYPPGGGLPSGIIPEAYGAVWNVLLFDGALAHLSSAVHDRARKELGCVISWGAPGHFERRPNVERTFRRIADDIFKRLPSTTGSNPYNGRAPDGEVKALRYKIRANEAGQMLDVYLAQHNATPCEGISFLTPLEYIRHFLNDQYAGFVLRTLPEISKQGANMFSVTEEVTVRGSIKDGRRPYIQLDRVHYTSPVLVELGNLIGEKMFVEIDEDDMRQVKAFLKNGAELGFLTAKGRWAESKHSRRTRKAINSLVSKRILIISEFDDPVRVYLSHLSVQNKQRSTSPIPRKQATDATRVAKEANLPLKIGATPTRQTNRVSDIPAISAVAPRRSLMDKDPPVLRLVKNRR